MICVYVAIWDPLIVAHGIEHLVKLESKRGPLPNYSPAIEEVLEYLTEVKHKTENMRTLV